MLTIRLSAKRSSRYPTLSFLRRTFFCLLALLGPIALRPVQGQNLWSPCPNVFSNEFSPDSNQWVGYVQLQGIHIGQLVKLNVDLSMGIPISQNNVGSINLVKSGEQTFVDIENNLPAQYRIDIQLKNVIPNVLAISVNDQRICTGRNATDLVVATINLEYTLFTQMLPQENGNGNGNNNVSVVQHQLTESSAPPIPFYRPMQTPAPPPQVITQSPGRLSVNDNSEGIEIDCGTPAQIFNRLSINGIRTPRGQFPWASPVFEQFPSLKPKYICGSTIITPTHLVTAANCMYDSFGIIRIANNLATAPGMYDIENFYDYGLLERKVAKIYIHEHYNHEDLEVVDSDIAVLTLDFWVFYDNFIRPICLWSESDSLEMIVGLKGFVSGWGVTENGKAKYPSYVTATVVDRRSCASNMGKFIANSSRVFCADGQGSSPCTGDSGNGLVMKRGTRFYLRGIVSAGQLDPNTLSCSLKKYVLYTDIAPFRYWLYKVIEESSNVY